jgi:hypothetical protein
VLVAVRFSRRERFAEERAAPERDEREGVDGRGRGRLVAALFGRAVVEVAVLAKPAKRALVYALHDAGDVRLLGRLRVVEAHAVAVLLEDAIYGQRVEVDVQIEASTKSLRKRDGACLRALDVRETLGRARDLFCEDAAEDGQYIGLGGRYASKFEGKAQDPLTHGRVGQDSIGDACRLVAHPPRAAAWADAALFT